MTPKVSVIVPVYNVEQYLKQCLESICAQTLKDIEIICINDGSTDGSLKILESYAKKDKRIKIIDKQNEGYGKTMNLGIQIAKAEYIGIVESDDFIESNMYEELYTHAKRHDADMIRANYFEHIKNRDKLSCELSFFKDDFIVYPLACPKILSLPPRIWSGIYSKKFLDTKSIRFLETPKASYQDVSFSFKTMSLAERILILHAGYYHYRADRPFSSSNSKDKAFDILKEYDEINELISSNISLQNPIILKEKLLREFGSYEWNLWRMDRSYRHRFIQEIHKIFTSYLADPLYKGVIENIDKKKIHLLLHDIDTFTQIYTTKAYLQKLKNLRKSFIRLRLRKDHIHIEICGAILYSKVIGQR